MIKKFPLFSYLLFTFIVSWLFWTIPILVSAGIYKNDSLNSIYGYGVSAPLIITIILTLKINGTRGLKTLFSKFSFRGIKPRWFLTAAFLLIPVCVLTVLFHGIIFGNPGKVIQWYTLKNYFAALPFLLIYATLEEVGWRGFALPYVRKRFNALASALILGIIWGLWHLPKVISEGMKDIPSLIVFEVFVVLVSVLITWIYENTNGSTSLVILTHAAGNAAIYGININILAKISFNSATVIFEALLIIFMSVIILYSGPDLRREKIMKDSGVEV